MPPSPTPAQTSQGLIRNYLLIVGLYTSAASIVWGINTLYLLESGFSLFEIFVSNAVFTGAMALFEIPTGVIADVSGRRRSFLLSVAILATGTLAYVAVADLQLGVPALMAVSTFLGLGYTFYSGAVEAWIVDGLHHLDAYGKVDDVLARGAFVSAAAMLLGTVGGGLLATLSYHLPYFVRAGLLGGLFLLALRFMHDHGFAPGAMTVAELPRRMRQLARDSVSFGWSESRIRLVILASAAQAILMAWGFHAWQPYFLGLLGNDAAWIAGVIAALIASASMLGNWGVRRLTQYCGRRTTLLLWSATVFTLAMIAVGLSPSFWIAVPAYLVATVAMGVFGPIRQAYIHGLVKGENRATVLSFASLVSSAASMGGQTGLGQLARMRSLSDGYVAGGAATAVALPLLLLLRRIGGPADAICGTEAKTPGCAAQVLAEVTGLETAAQ